MIIRCLNTCVSIAMMIFIGRFALGLDGLQDYNEIVLLVSDVQEYYKAASVFIVYAGDDESIGTTTLLQHLLLEFSSKFVSSLTLNYSDIIIHHEIYYKHIVKPLFVVLLSSNQEIEWFQESTTRYDMSYAVWIVVFTDPNFEACHKPNGNFFNLAFNTEMLVKCQGDPVIREWYSLHEGHTKINDLALWKPDRRFQLLTGKSLNERRSNLEGKNFPVTIVKESQTIAEQQGGHLAGYFASVLLELSKSTNFTFTVAYKEESPGIYNESLGQWTGAMSRLERQEVEFGVSELTMTVKRLDIVDFTFPIMMSRNHFYVRQPDGSALNWFAYFQVYSIDIWIAIIALFILSIFVITYLRLKIKEKPIPPNYISENFLQLWGIYWQQGLPELPTSLPMRIAYFSVFLKALILYSIYSACLISYLTVTSPSLPFNDMEGLLKDGSYKILSCRESAHFEYFSTSTDSVTKEMMKMMPSPDLLPRTMTGGFQKVCSDRAAFYTTGNVKNLVNSQIPCSVIPVNTGRIDSLAIALKKGSNYRGLLNYHLLKFQDIGIMKRMFAQQYQKVSPADTTYNPVNIGSVITIILILIIGVFLSLVILLCEIFIHRTTSAQQKQQIKPEHHIIEIVKNFNTCLYQ